MPLPYHALNEEELRTVEAMTQWLAHAYMLGVSEAWLREVFEGELHQLKAREHWDGQEMPVADQGAEPVTTLLPALAPPRQLDQPTEAYTIMSDFTSFAERLITISRELESERNRATNPQEARRLSIAITHCEDAAYRLGPPLEVKTT